MLSPSNRVHIQLCESLRLATVLTYLVFSLKKSVPCANVRTYKEPEKSQNTYLLYAFFWVAWFMILSERSGIHSTAARMLFH